MSGDFDAQACLCVCWSLACRYHPPEYMCRTAVSRNLSPYFVTIFSAPHPIAALFLQDCCQTHWLIHGRAWCVWYIASVLVSRSFVSKLPLRALDFFWQGLFLATGSLQVSTPYLGGVLLAVISAWLLAADSLSKKVGDLQCLCKAPRLGASQLARRRGYEL